MIKKIRFCISPNFLIKFYLVRDIRVVNKKYNFFGSLLDIGCGEKPYKNLFKGVKDYIGIDFNNYSINKDFISEKPDCYFSDEYFNTLVLPFASESFDNVVSFQVLEHHKNPHKMICEMFRVIKPNGYILLTVPFIFGIHEEPHDYQRFTKYGLAELLKEHDCEILEIKKQGSIFSTVSTLFNGYLDNFAAKNKYSYIFSVVLYLPFLLFQYLSLFLDLIFKSDKIFINYLFLIRKNN
jgi:SAM-dependent methyltransferase